MILAVRHKAFERPLPSQTDAERGPGLGSLVEGSNPLGRLALALGKGVDLRAHRRPRRAPGRPARRWRRAAGRHARRARPAAAAARRRPASACSSSVPRRQANVQRGEHGVAAPVDQRRRHIEGVPCDQLIEDGVPHRAIGTFASPGARGRRGLASAQLRERVAATVVACELVVERRQLLRAQVDDLDLEAHRASRRATGSRSPPDTARRARGARRGAGRRAGARARAGSSRRPASRSTPSRRVGSAPSTALAQVQRDDVSRLDHLPVRRSDAAGRPTRAASRARARPRRRVTTDDGRTTSRPPSSPSAIVRPDVDGRRVAQRLARRERVGVDLGRADHGELMLVHGVMERVLDQTAQHLAADLLAEHALEHAARRLARPEPGKSRLPADLRERAIELGLHGRRGDLDLQALAARPELLDRHRGVLVRVRESGNSLGASMGESDIATATTISLAMREGGLEPPRLPARS